MRTSLGDVTLPILRKHLAGFFTVEEDEIVSAMRFAFDRLKIVIEPSSAVALAPLLRREQALIGKRVGVIVTGGNVDLSSFFEKLLKMALPQYASKAAYGKGDSDEASGPRSVGLRASRPRCS